MKHRGRIPGDQHHRALQADNWLWDGTAYTRWFDMGKAVLRLTPEGTTKGLTMVELRGEHNRWTLKIGVNQGMWHRVCSYKTFNDAARALLGNA